MAQISLIKMVMVFVITVRMPINGKEITTAVEWVISIVMDRVKEIVAEMDMAISTDMVAGIKMHLPLNLKNPTTRISKHAFNEEANIFLTFGGILASFYL